MKHMPVVTEVVTHADARQQQQQQQQQQQLQQQQAAPKSVYRYWSEDAPLSTVLREPAGTMLRRDMMSTRSFFDRLLRFGELLYYSRPILEASAGLAEEVTPSTSMWVDRHEVGNSTTLWLGGNGVETALHYDMSHNFFVQLVGEKRFFLSQPSMHRRLCLFPWLHPLGIFTQRGEAGEEEDQPAADALVAHLHQGDVLYIPPLWFHSAQALSRLSVGINMWSNSVEGDLSGLAGVPPLPDALFSRTSSAAERVWLLRATIDALLDEVLTMTPEDSIGEKRGGAASGERSSTWVFHLIRERYQRAFSHYDCDEVRGECSATAYASAHELDEESPEGDPCSRARSGGCDEGGRRR